MSIRNRAIDNQLIKPVNGLKGWKQKTKLTDLQKELAEALNIPFADFCCEAGVQTPLGFPVRYTEEGGLERLSDDGTWISITFGSFLSSVTYDPTNTVTFAGQGTVLDPLEANVRISTDARSTSLFGSDTTGLFLNSPKLRDASASTEFRMFTLDKGVLADSLDPAIVKNGAMSTATITKQGDYDRIAVTGGDATSYFTLGRQFTLDNYIVRVRVKINSIGTAPLLGFKGIWPGSTYSNFNNPQPSGYANLTTGALTTSVNGDTLVSSYNGWSGTVVANNIIEFTIERNIHRDTKYTISKLNATGIEVSDTYYTKNVSADSCVTHGIFAITLADGDYTLLDVSVEHLEAHRPLLLTVGDSISVSVRIPESDSFTSKFKSKQPYQAANVGAGSCLLKGMLASVWQVLRLKPKYLAIFNYLDAIYFDYSNTTSGSYATWSADFEKYRSLIIANGITPIWCYPKTLPILDPTGSKAVHFTTYLSTNHPTDLVVTLESSEVHVDGTGFHLNGVSNDILADKVVTLLQTAGAI
jgi:hypothetical protein